RVLPAAQAGADAASADLHRRRLERHRQASDQAQCGLDIEPQPHRALEEAHRSDTRRRRPRRAVGHVRHACRPRLLARPGRTRLRTFGTSAADETGGRVPAAARRLRRRGRKVPRLGHTLHAVSGKWGTSLALAAIGLALAGCTHNTPAPTASPALTAAVSAAPSAPSTVAPLDDETAKPSGAQPVLASDPAQLADDLVADEQALRDPSTPEAALQAAARRQQAAYRAIGRDSQLDATARPRIPAALQQVYDLNVD